MRRCCILFLVIALEAAASVIGDTQVWWKTASLYQIYPKSFKDSNGDGVGDLKGITQMAGYFKELGVDAVWMSPIYNSPMVDAGYDITDFTGIDPIFGTMADFDELVSRFKELDVKILLDFVPNHSSDEHEWFKKSVLNDTDYRDFYVWVDPKFLPNGTRIPPNNWLSLFGGSAWEWNEQRQQYYLHQFTIKQPDFNYRNPALLGNMTAVINFWLDKGVDGLRVDAVPYLYEDEQLRDEPAVPGTAGDTWFNLQHNRTRSQPETFTLLKYWADVLNNRVKLDGKPRVALLEAIVPEAPDYYLGGAGSLAFPFNFMTLYYGNQARRSSEYKAVIETWINSAPTGGQLNWVFGSHDRPRVADKDKFGPELVDAINLLSGVLPGIKVTYYGEEIGMTNTFIRWDQTDDPIALNLGPNNYLRFTRDPERTPMQWDDSVSAGFSTNLTTWLPVNPNYWRLNVNAQRNSENSHLKVFQNLLKARKDPVLQNGGLNVASTPDNNTLLVIRDYQGSSFVLLVNVGSENKTYTSRNLFSAYSLDVNLYVVVSSVNAGYYKPGQFMQQGSLSVTLRPKAAVLLTTKVWTSSSAPSLQSFSFLLASLVLMLFRI